MLVESALLALALVQASGAAVDQKPLLIDEVRAAYTDAALKARIQGVVGLDVQVLEDGTVGDASVTGSLDTVYGLDQQAVAAVKQWRFKPATKNGVPIPARTRVGVPFILPGAMLPGQYLFPSSAKDAWQALVQLAQELGFAFDTFDEADYVLVTRPKRYDARRFPKEDALGLSAGEQPHTLQLHLASTPDLEPARVAIRAVLDVEHGFTTRRIYGHEAIEAWLLQMLTARLGVKPVPLPAAFEERAALAKRMLPAGLIAACSPTLPIASARSIVPPKDIIKIQPAFPRGGQPIPTNETEVEGILTEHGTLFVLRIVKPSPETELLERAARLATGLWRYKPAMADGCPVPATMSVTVYWR